MVSNKWQWCAAWVIAATWCGAGGELHAQCQTQRLFPADGAAGDQFGTSVDIDGDRIVVGTPLHNGTIGAAYIYVRTPTGWLHEAKLTDEYVLPSDDFARTVSISGDYAAVGAPKTDKAASPDVGRVYIFSRIGAAWMAETLSTPVFLFAGSEFGASVSLSGDAVLIGAPFTDGVTLPTGAGNSGSAFIFRRNAATGVWSQEAMLTASDAQELDQFGTTVALHGDTAFVTAFGDKDPTISQNNTIGSVYVFRKQQGSWVQVKKLVPSDAAAQALLGPRNFGRSLSTDGTVLLVGERTGQSAYVFRFNGTAWIEEAILKKPVGNTGFDQFGQSVAIQGDLAFVGAILDDDNGLSNSGTVFAFRRVGGVWINQALIYADMPLASARLSASMAIDHGDLVVGAIEAGGGQSGSVHVFATAAANDCDVNGQSDICEIGDDPTLDADGNGTLDVCDCALDAECNDGLDCTVDTCNPVTHVCDFTLMPGACRINGVCHASGAFNPVVHCQVCDPTQSTSAWSVDQDGTVCDPPATQCMLGGFCQSGQCVQVPKPVGASCGNPNSSDCDDPDICNGAGTCFANPKPNNFPCTDNGQFCDGTERCLLGQCTSTGINPCGAATMTPICDDELDRCVECLQNAQCVDSIECTADVCDANGLCQNGPAPAGTFCGSAGDTICDGRDTCNGAGTCQTNLAPLGTLCGSITNTDCNQPDTCNGAGACLSNFLPNGTGCTSNGLFCDGMESCQNGACVPSGVNPCQTQFNPKNCDEATDTCFTCSSSTQCGDGNPCTADACSPSGLCLHSPAAPGAACGLDPSCDTVRTCAGGQCVGAFTPNGTPCPDDGDVCTFDECQSGVCAHLPAEFEQPCGPDDCNCNEVYDLCEIEEGDAEDCNANDIPDECERPVFTLDSGNLSPIGDGYPQVFMATGLPEALGDVTLTLSAQADLFSAAEWIDVSINGQFVHRFFTVIGFDCANNPDVEAIVLTAAQFNGMVAGGAVDSVLTASAQVRADLCTPDSYVRVRLEYMAPGEGDCDGNSVPDECDLAADPANDCNGNEVLDRCELAAGAATDCNQNGRLDVCDLTSGLDVDCNGNMLPDGCEPDCQGNGIADECDVTSGASADCDGNLVPDECLTAHAHIAMNAAQLAVHGDTALVADADAPLGRFQILRRVSDVWQVEDALQLPGTPGSPAQYVLAINEDVAAIGDGNLNGVGGVYVFRRDLANQWNMEATLFSPEPMSGGQFGRAIALSGHRLLVGEPSRGCDALPRSVTGGCGAAYVFNDSGGQWMYEAGLASPQPLSGRYFGTAVTLGDEWAMIGEPDGSPDGSSQSGAVHAFRRGGSAWSWHSAFGPNANQLPGDFGALLAMDGVRILVFDTNSFDPAVQSDWAAYVYGFDGNAWVQESRLSDPAFSPALGVYMALDDPYLTLGFRSAAVNYPQHGAVMLFRREVGSWTLDRNIFTPDPSFDGQSRMQFGAGISGVELLVPSVLRDNTGHFTRQVTVMDIAAAPCFCPVSDIVFIDPPNGVIDARQNIEINGQSNSQGIDSLIVMMEDQTGSACWRFHPRPNAPGGLRADSVRDNGDGSFTVEFAYPTLPGSNPLLYTDNNGTVTAAAFISHPSNVDGGPFADAGDVTAHIQCCLGGSVCGPEYDQYRCDINHSQVTTAEDLIRVLDLLNGGSVYFNDWLGTPLPTGP